MARCVAFLRAINVGGHTVTMDRLRTLFESMGFAGVETFIASGNVLFDSSARNHATLERRIERGLREALGYEVAAFVRTGREVATVAGYSPFEPALLAEAAALNVGFLHAPLAPAAARALVSLQTDIDVFHVHGREWYWMCRRKQSESAISNAVIEKTLRVPCTLRGINTVRRLADKIRPQ